MATFAKPENALKRAEELINVGQKQAALQALHDLITSKRYRTWQKTLENIMMKYVELCVDMRKGRFAKDGLIQYRIVCQQVNVSSLEEVIKHFLKLSNQKVEQVQAQIQVSELTLDVEDLEAEKSPEDLMVSYVSGEKGKERADRELVTPWFKFLWETFRTVLEILRNNSRLEALYAMTAHKAFQFCLQYRRNTEFRRLCEIIRNHLANLNKYKEQRDRPDLNQPESLQFYLETRFEQLKVATELELWQEAFRSVEDIYNLMSMVKKVPKPQMMAVYYSKLTKIFWVSENHLFHAYAWYKLYILQKNFNRNLKEKDLQYLASSVLLSTLSISPCDVFFNSSHSEVEMEKDRNFRMMNLLTFNFDSSRDNREVLSRASLLQELISKGVMVHALPEVKEVYSLLENDFHPLDLTVKAQKLFDSIASFDRPFTFSSSLPNVTSPLPQVDLTQYIPLLQKLSTLRLLQQASKVYETVKIKNVCRIIPFLSFSEIEKIIVDAVKYNFIQLKIDHQQGVLQYGDYHFESDKLKNNLICITQKLNDAVKMINSKNIYAKATEPKEVDAKGKLNVKDLKILIKKEHERLLSRKILIERRKEEAERELMEKEKEEMSMKLKLQRQTEELEAKRLAQESARRKEERIRKELEEKEIEDAKKLMEELEKKKGKKGKKAIDSDTGKLTKKQLVEDLLSEQMKEKQEKEKRIVKIGKQMDYLERAKREEERPLIEDAYKKYLIEHEDYHNSQYSLLVEAGSKQHALDLVEKIRLSRMTEDKQVFEAQVVSRRKGEFERLKKERDEKLAELREMRRMERMQFRKMEYYRRQEEAKLIRIREEEEARKREELERKKREEEERLKKLEEIAAKQRQREMEAEEKARKEKEALLASQAPTSAPEKFVPPFRRGAGEARGSVSSEPWGTWRTSEPVAARTGVSSTEDKWTRVGSQERESQDRPREAQSMGRYVPPSRMSSERDTWGDSARRSDAFGREGYVRSGGPRLGSERDDRFGASKLGPERDERFGASKFGSEREDRFGAPRSGAEREDRFGAPRGGAERDDRFGTSRGNAEREGDRDKDAPPRRPGVFRPPHLR